MARAQKTDYFHNYKFHVYSDHIPLAKKCSREVIVVAGANEKEKDTAVAKFDGTPGAVLVATDALSEGVDLQQRCHHMIHFDLPFRPYRLEQRNGRIDRKGQNEQCIIRLMTPNESAVTKAIEGCGPQEKEQLKVLTTTLGLGRLYGMLNKQRKALGGSVVPVLESLKSLKKRSDSELLENLDSVSKEVGEFRFDPEAAQKEWASSSYDFVTQKTSNLKWSGAHAMGLSRSILPFLSAKIRSDLNEYWTAFSTDDCVEMDTKGRVTGNGLRGLLKDMYPGLRVPPEEGYAFCAERDCVNTDDAESLTLGNGLWDEIAGATHFRLFEHHGINVGLSTGDSPRPIAVALWETPTGTVITGCEKSGSFSQITPEAARAVVEQELNFLTLKEPPPLPKPTKECGEFAQAAFAFLLGKNLRDTQTGRLICMILSMPKQSKSGGATC